MSHYAIRWDFLEVFDGPDASSPLIGRYCGIYQAGFVIQGSASTLFLRFVSDHVVTHSGFTATISGMTTYYFHLVMPINENITVRTCRVVILTNTFYF